MLLSLLFQKSLSRSLRPKREKGQSSTTTDNHRQPRHRASVHDLPRAEARLGSRRRGSLLRLHQRNYSTQKECRTTLPSVCPPGDEKSQLQNKKKVGGGGSLEGGKTVTKAPRKSSLEKDTETQQVCSQKSPEFMKCTAGTVWSPSTAPLITTLEGNGKKLPTPARNT